MSANKMRLCLFCISIIFYGTFSFHQHDYHLIVERANITYCNKSLVNNIKVQSYYVTRYSKRFNASGDLLEDLDANKLTFHLEARKFQSNEYRLFPFNNSENVCSGFHNKRFGNSINEFETNFIPNCFIKKGHYYVNDIHYDESKFPPYAPRGRYLLIGRLVYSENILIATSEVHIAIKPQTPLERTIGG